LWQPPQQEALGQPQQPETSRLNWTVWSAGRHGSVTAPAAAVQRRVVQRASRSGRSPGLLLGLSGACPLASRMPVQVSGLSLGLCRTVGNKLRRPRPGLPPQDGWRSHPPHFSACRLRRRQLQQCRRGRPSKVPNPKVSWACGRVAAATAVQKMPRRLPLEVVEPAWGSLSPQRCGTVWRGLLGHQQCHGSVEALMWCSSSGASGSRRRTGLPAQAPRHGRRPSWRLHSRTWSSAERMSVPSCPSRDKDSGWQFQALLL